jgi:hypothetical protein
MRSLFSPLSRRAAKAPNGIWGSHEGHTVGLSLLSVGIVVDFFFVSTGGPWDVNSFLLWLENDLLFYIFLTIFGELFSSCFPSLFTLLFCLLSLS